MSDWSDLGLPCPSRDGYGYTRDLGLLRTPFPAPAPEQRQAREAMPLTFTLSWLLTGAQLALAEPYLLSQGYQGITLDLVSGASPDGVPVPHAVRLVADYEVTAIRPDCFRLAIKAETPVAITGSCISPVCDTLFWDEIVCPDPNLGIEISVIETMTTDGTIVSGEFPSTTPPSPIETATTDASIVGGEFTGAPTGPMFAESLFADADILSGTLI